MTTAREVHVEASLVCTCYIALIEETHFLSARKMGAFQGQLGVLVHVVHCCTCTKLVWSTSVFYITPTVLRFRDSSAMQGFGGTTTLRCVRHLEVGPGTDYRALITGQLEWPCGHFQKWILYPQVTVG